MLTQVNNKEDPKLTEKYFDLQPEDTEEVQFAGDDIDEDKDDEDEDEEIKIDHELQGKGKVPDSAKCDDPDQ
jgi:hypothetical protein